MNFNLTEACEVNLMEFSFDETGDEIGSIFI